MTPYGRRELEAIERILWIVLFAFLFICLTVEHANTLYKYFF